MMKMIDNSWEVLIIKHCRKLRYKDWFIRDHLFSCTFLLSTKDLKEDYIKFKWGKDLEGMSSRLRLW